VTDHIDKEIEAIKLVLSALEPLRPEVRTSVLRYVTGRLQIPQQQPVQASEQAGLAGGATGLVEPAMGQKSSQTHIKEFKEQKNPRYAIEMAAVVAYYLQDWPAPGSEDTELGVLMGPEGGHGETEVHARVQA
jgi:hypothetical protein